jgi:CRISPR system Cascade subunit CasA
MPTFDLVDDPWLPANAATLPARGVDDIPQTGSSVAEYGLRALLLDADRFTGLSVEIPTMLPALLRQTLLPIVVDALGQPKTPSQWLDHFRRGAFSDGEREQLSVYLDDCRGRFDLFDSAAPFAQVGGLHTAKGETKGSALLVATAATGNNVPLFASRTEGDTLALTPAEAARWLLHTHCWDTAAIKTGAVGDSQAKSGKTMGNPTGPLGQLGVVLPVGRTLYETLWLNIPVRADGRAKNDLPPWRRQPQGPEWEIRSAVGVVDLWTWQSRRIRLFPEDTADGVRVTRVIVAAGDRLRETSEDEPHTAWSLPAAGKVRPGAPEVPRRAKRHQPGKAPWRGLDALLAVEREEPGATAKKDGFATSILLNQLRGVLGRLAADYPLQMDLTGVFYGTQSAVVDDVFHDTIPLPLLSLPHDSPIRATVLEVADQAEQLARAVNNLSADLRRAAGAEPIPWDKGQRPGELVLHRLDPLVRRMLAGLRAAGDDDELVERGCLAWEQVAWRHTKHVADHVLATAAPSTFAGRIVEQNGKEITFRLGTAVTNFRRRVREILGRAAEARAAAAAAADSVSASTEDAVHV